MEHKSQNKSAKAGRFSYMYHKCTAHIKHIIIFFIFILVYFIICESVIRYENFGTICFNLKKMDSIHPLYNSEFVYAHSLQCGIMRGFVPNKSGYFKGSIFKTNSFGLRDKEYSLQKSKNTFRIINIGNSFTLGEGVSNDEVYSSVLETFLNDQSNDEQYEVWNAGYSGMSINCLLWKLQHSLSYNPDMILFQIPDRIGRGRTENLIRKLKKFQKQNGVSVMVFFPGTTRFLRKKEIKNGFLFDTLNVPVNVEDRAYPADWHPNRETHKKYAEKIFNLILENREIFIRNPQANSPKRKLQARQYKTNEDYYRSGFWRSYYFLKIKRRFNSISEENPFDVHLEYGKDYFVLPKNRKKKKKHRKPTKGTQ